MKPKRSRRLTTAHKFHRKKIIQLRLKYNHIFKPNGRQLRQGKWRVKKEKLLGVRKSHFASKPRNAVSGNAGKFTSCKKEKIAIHTIGQAKASTMIRAEEVQTNLESKFPSFVKSMVRSQVTRGFWMGLPLAFCKSHLPRKDTIIKLEDEHGGTYEARFLAAKTGLSAGWKQFSVGHKLLEGDALVFQLIEPIKFRVYVIRANYLTKVDEALTLLNLDAHTKQNDREMGAVACNNMKRKRRSKSLSLAIVQNKIKRTGMPPLPRLIRKFVNPAKQSKKESKNVGSEVLEGFRFPVSKSSSFAMEFDEEIQNEGEEKETPSFEPSQEISQEEDHLTLAVISQTWRTSAPPKPNPSSVGKQKSKVENETLVRSKKSRSASKPRNAISEQARKCTREKGCNTYSWSS